MNNKTPISKEILILDLVEQYPELIETLTEKYGFHCVGCLAASMESLEEGAKVHGMSKSEIDSLVEELKKKVNPKN